MSELRAPDPTLSDLPPATHVWLDDHRPRTAHTGWACSHAHNAHWLEETQDARWFAIPCPKCFPDAPPPGLTLKGLPLSLLAWQTPPPDAAHPAADLPKIEG